jgi:hypothetical protein
MVILDRRLPLYGGAHPGYRAIFMELSACLSIRTGRVLIPLKTSQELNGPALVPIPLSRNWISSESSSVVVTMAPPYNVTVPIQVFCGGVKHQIDAVFYGSQEVGGGECVIADS